MASIPLNHNSRNISKLKPNIRIVHLIAPEIIQTDITNFRNLVQELTGKPTNNRTKLKLSANTNPNEPVYQQKIEKIEMEEKVVKCEGDQWILEGSTSSNFLNYLEEEGSGEVEGFFQSTFDLSTLFDVSS
ncbi:hypothetical protein LUZ60_017033 [Juncus effusus]|nr:hypothetical protein LUZ60_017033 [Juncus effusus]